MRDFSDVRNIPLIPRTSLDQKTKQKLSLIVKLLTMSDNRHRIRTIRWSPLDLRWTLGRQIDEPLEWMSLQLLAYDSATFTKSNWTLVEQQDQGLPCQYCLTSACKALTTLEAIWNVIVDARNQGTLNPNVDVGMVVMNAYRTTNDVWYSGNFKSVVELQSVKYLLIELCVWAKLNEWFPHLASNQQIFVVTLRRLSNGDIVVSEEPIRFS